MARRALLIGSEFEDLRGVANDLAAMQAALERFGFEHLTCCHGAQATRDGILAAVRDFIASVQPGDVALLYYAGHGSRADRPGKYRDGRSIPEFIVPIDFTMQGEFRGITSWELSRLMVALTRRTQNVTVIMDCCHAGRIVRGTPGDRDAPVWKPPASGKHAIRGFQCWNHEGFLAHVETLRSEHGLERWNIEANPHVVRILACASNAKAYEVHVEKTTDGGDREEKPHGALTAALCQALDAVEDRRVSWHTIGLQIDAVMKAQTATPRQSPQFEGPRYRYLFEEDQESPTGKLAILRDGHTPFLGGGRIHGVRDGDEYMVIRASGSPLNDRDKVATATVTRTSNFRAALEVTYHGKYKAIEPGSPAYLQRSSRPPVPVHIAPALPVAVMGQLGEALHGSTSLIHTDDPTHAEQTAELRGDQLRVSYPSSSATGPAVWQYDHQEPAWIIGHIARLAHALHVRGLATDTPDNNTSGGRYALGWGAVENGQKIPSPAEISENAALYVEVTNHRLPWAYVSIFHVGVDGHVRLLSTAMSSGRPVQRTKSFTLGQDDRRDVLVGVQLPSSTCIADARDRTESLMVFIGDRPVDLRALETRFPEKEEGTKRHAKTMEEEWYRIVRIDFRVRPAERV